MRYYEDLDVGTSVTTGRVTVTEPMIREFAQAYDPQPFHTDPEAAKLTFFEGLVASGWQTAALTMRLMVDSDFQIAGGLIGMGLDTVRWPTPVRPGDILCVTITIAEKRLSESRPGFGIITTEIATHNQRGDVVMRMRTHMWIPCRATGVGN
ncbi:MAG: MaoC family dehydratase [Alphaproteobacteria bacterium]|nr:MaoC family dehydratase [Alphaproteobacteria bacterium]